MDEIIRIFTDPVKAIEFGYRLKAQFDTNKAYRRAKELEWLEDIRQVKGIYDPDVKIEAGNSKVYPKITRSKINIVLSRLHEMLFPENDRNWEAIPTPEPSISEETVVEIARSLLTEDENGEPIFPDEDEINLAIKKYAKETCEKMVSVMDDQFTEMDYSEETKKVLRSGLTYGTGVMKGVLIRNKTKRKWKPVDNGDYEEATDNEDVPFFEFVRLWDWYPDMSVTDLDTMDGSFERHVMTKHDLRELMKRDDFYPGIIRKHLEEHPSGDYVAENWEIDLQVIDVQAGADKTSAGFQTNNDDDKRSANRQTGKKYQVLEYWGYVDGSDLEACGVTVDDVSLEYAANVWLLGGKPIKVALYYGVLDKYKVFYYEKDETSIYGEGLARVMRHSQISISAGSRMLLDNAACTAGPQVEVNMSLLAPDTDVDSIYARKIWFREGRGIEAQYPAIRGLEFNSHIDELLTVIDTFKGFADEETCLPTWMIGERVNNETAQAASGRMATITIAIKDVVKNFDAFTEGIIQDLYAWNMDFNPRQDIKGDYMCKARGVSSLVMKEIRMQALNQLSTTMTEEDWIYVDRREFLNEKFKAHDINITLRSEEEADKIRTANQESIQMQLAIQMQQAEVGYKKAQTMAQLSKARENNVDAVVKSQGEDTQLVDAQTDKVRVETELLLKPEKEKKKKDVKQSKKV